MLYLKHSGTVNFKIRASAELRLRARGHWDQRSGTLDFYFTSQHVAAVQISHHRVDVGYTARIIREKSPLYSDANYNPYSPKRTELHSFCVSDICLMMADLDSRNMWHCIIKDCCSISAWLCLVV